jgi:kinetochore protein Spc7/SPC105
VYSSELEESLGKLEALKARLGELKRKKGECEVAISVAKGRCDQFTRSDVLRLNSEFLYRSTTITITIILYRCYQ